MYYSVSGCGRALLHKSSLAVKRFQAPMNLKKSEKSTFGAILMAESQATSDFIHATMPCGSPKFSPECTIDFGSAYFGGNESEDKD
jgi:hypothetical protein